MGFYITFDGGSGTGKGTIINSLYGRLIRRRFNRLNTVTILRDNELDPLREYGAKMLPWCEKNKIERKEFLLPLFVAGAAISEININSCILRCDFVLRDRSFISALAYQTINSFSQEQLWDLYVNHVRVRIPNLVVIVDCNVEIALEREAKRKQGDKDLGGKISGNNEDRIKIRENFLKIPLIFSDRLNVVVIENSGEWIDDKNIIEQRTNAIVDEIVSNVKELKGVE